MNLLDAQARAHATAGYEAVLGEQRIALDDELLSEPAGAAASTRGAT